MFFWFLKHLWGRFDVKETGFPFVCVGLCKKVMCFVCVCVCPTEIAEYRYVEILNLLQIKSKFA